MNTNSKLLMSAAIAGLMGAGTLVHAADTTAASTDAPKGHCMAANSCKGTSACKTAKNDCAGKNGCSGQGFTESTKAECVATAKAAKKAATDAKSKRAARKIKYVAAK